MADAIAITKADGANEKNAELAKEQFQDVLQLYPPKESRWNPAVLTCSSFENKGIMEIWEQVAEHHKLMQKTGKFEKKRRDQSVKWMNEAVLYGLKDKFYNNEVIKRYLGKLEKEVAEGKTSPFAAAQELLKTYFENFS